MRQAGLIKIKYALIIFPHIILLSLASHEFVIPELTKKAEDFRKSKVTSSGSNQPVMIIEKIDDGNFVMVSEQLAISFNDEGELWNLKINIVGHSVN